MQGFEGGDTLLLRRSVDQQGKSRGWVNGSPATAQQLRNLGEHLLDIHGQHAWQSLTRPDGVRGLLDAYAQIPAGALHAAWTDWRKAHNALQAATQAQDQLQRERERLLWQIAEVDKLAPRPREWAELNASHTRLAHGQALLDAAHQAVELLDQNDHNALRQVHLALHALQSQAHLEPEFANPVDLIGSSVAQLEDVVHTLRGYTRRTELDPQRLAELDARITLWVSLARRHKCPPEDLCDLLAGWRSRLVQLDAAADLDALQRAERKAHAALVTEAKALSRQRAEAAPRLAQQITDAMQDWACKAGSLWWRLSRWNSPRRAAWRTSSFWWPGTPAARRGPWARWHRAASSPA